MSSFPLKPDGVQIWSDFEAATPAGTHLHSIEDVVTIGTAKALIGEETLLVVVAATSTAVAFALRRRVVRLVFEDDTVEEWRIVKVDKSDLTEEHRVTIQCEGAIMSLNGPCLVENIDDNGAGRTRFELLEFSATEHIENFVLPAAPDWWQLGLVETAERFDLLYDHYTPLRAIAEILRITGFEREVERLDGGIHVLKIVEFSGVFRVAFENALEVWTVPATINLVNYTSKTPEIIGAWEYNGAAADWKVNAGSSFGIERGVNISIDLKRWARTTQDITDDSFRVTARIARLGVAAANTAMGIYLFAETTVSAASIVGEGLTVWWEETSGSEFDLFFERRNAAGAVVDSGTLAIDQKFEVDTEGLLRLVVNKTRKGATQVVEVFETRQELMINPLPDLENLKKIGEIDLGVDFRDGDHKAHGVYQVEIQGRIREWLLESLPQEEAQPVFEIGKNAPGISREQDDRDTATKIYGVGGTDQLGRISIAAARFDVTALP